jgi:MFS family permease
MAAPLHRSRSQSQPRPPPGGGGGPVRSTVPARLDRLPWSSFHWRVIVALGITWTLDGIEITIAASIGDRLREAGTLGFTTQEVGLAASLYLAGEVVGALLFGRLADELGRRRLFLATLSIYLLGNALTALSFNFPLFAVTRIIAGMGIGGEYAAINSAIDELIPSHSRGRADLAVNGTYWLGAMIGASANFLFLNPSLFPLDFGWRLGLLVGPILGLLVWSLRRHIPESPRWLLAHGRAEEAERIVTEIEREIERKGVSLPRVSEDDAVEVVERVDVGYLDLLRLLLRDFRRRSVVGFTLMSTQAFLYNAIFFTYALILTDFYGISDETVALFIFPFALGNLLGPLTLGRLFDTVGRRRMIGGTYIGSGVLLFLTGWLFQAGVLDVLSQTLLWCVIFFIASAAASSAYLTVSETFPVEIRAQAIALFFALSMLAGGVVAPSLFATLIQGADPQRVFLGYAIAAALMILGGLVEFGWGIDAERKSLEEIARPLSMTPREHLVGEALASGVTGGLHPHVRRVRRE